MIRRRKHQKKIDSQESLENNKELDNQKKSREKIQENIVLPNDGKAPVHDQRFSISPAQYEGLFENNSKVYLVYKNGFGKRNVQDNISHMIFLN